MVAQNSQETTESFKAAASLAQNLDRSQLKDKTRVYSLAKQLGLSSRELVAQLKDMGLKKSAQSSLSREEAGQVLDTVANAAAVADAPETSTQAPAEEAKGEAAAQPEEHSDEEREKKPPKKRAKRARKATRKSAAVAPEEPADAVESGEGEQSAEDEEHLRHRVRKNVDNEISQIEDKVEASLALSLIHI